MRRWPIVDIGWRRKGKGPASGVLQEIVRAISLEEIRRGQRRHIGGDEFIN